MNYKKQIVKWKKSDTKKFSPYDSINAKFPNRKNKVFFMDTFLASETHYKERTDYHRRWKSSSSGEKKGFVLWRGLWDPEQRAQLIHAQLLTTSNGDK